MRVANLDGRLVVVTGVAGRREAVDVERASGGRLPADPAAAYDRWDDLRRWADAGGADGGPGEPFDPAALGPPSPRPRQVFALSLNYRDLLGEPDGSGVVAPAVPSVFTKFPTSLAGAHGVVALPTTDSVDWEVELVVVVGRPAHGVPAAAAWDHVAGVTLGQDLTERRLQFAVETPQFSLAKSYPGFSPTGPWLVTPDELADPDDVEIGCRLNGEQVQHARTSQMIFGVPEIVAHLSSVVVLLPGDLIFTGSPSGVGGLREPPRYLRPGDELTSHAPAIGEMHHTFTTSTHPFAGPAGPAGSTAPEQGRGG